MRLEKAVKRLGSGKRRGRGGEGEEEGGQGGTGSIWTEARVQAAGDPQVGMTQGWGSTRILSSPRL